MQPKLKVPFRNANHISWQDRNRGRYRILAHGRLAAALNLDCILARSVCGTASDRECSEHVEPTLVRIFAWFRDLAHHVKRPERRNRNGDLWISEIFAAEFLSQCLLKFGLRQA